MHELTDLSPMPFGKYTGRPMQDVPARYLHWLWTQGLEHDKQSNVAAYIRKNIVGLKAEYEDGIW